MNIKLVIEPNRERINSRDFSTEYFDFMSHKKRLRTKEFQINAKVPSVLVLLSNNDINISKLFSFHCSRHQVSNYLFFF